MYRNQFTNILQHFTKTMGAETGVIDFYTKTSTGEMGLGGEKMTLFKRAIAIVIINNGNTINTSTGKQEKTNDGSVRSVEGELLNKYFYFRKKRYKIINKRDINGTLNGQYFYHYDFVEG